MAYFHIDRAQDYIQGLGVLNANNRQTRIDVNAFPADNSFYLPDPGGKGTGSIAFGDGGVDDAEDGDVIVHEYGHAIQDNQVPGLRRRPRRAAPWGRASATTWRRRSPRRSSPPARSARASPSGTPWASELPGDPPCLRRTDRDLTLAQAQAGQGCSDPGEFIYCGGEAWSGALWDIRTEVGRRGGGPQGDRVPRQPRGRLGPPRGIAGAGGRVRGRTRRRRRFVRTLLSQRGLYDTERLDDVPGAARSLAVPGSRAGFLQRRPRRRRRVQAPA